MQFNDVIKKIKECDRLQKVYSNISQALKGEGDLKLNGYDEGVLNERLENGEIKSLEDLADHFDQLADQQYFTANRILKANYKVVTQ